MQGMSLAAAEHSPSMKHVCALLQGADVITRFLFVLDLSQGPFLLGCHENFRTTAGAHATGVHCWKPQPNENCPADGQRSMPGCGCGCIVELLRGVFSNDDALVSGEYFALISLCFVLVVQGKRVAR